jgi:hypothetical protein
MVLINNINYELSERKNKKLKAFVNGKWVHFGNINYQNFRDLTNLLDKSFSHNDIYRQYNYLKRASNIRDKHGNLTVNDINSPNYHAVRILWM